MSKTGRRIAVTGKGGSGKTAFTAIATTLLASNGKQRILAIDADSAVGLPYALGVEVRKTVAQVRREVIEDPGARREMESKHVREAMREIVQAAGGFDLLSMGRPEGPGCFCATNDLLRYGIDALAKEYDITLIDCEAGPEQVNRRVVNGVDFIVIVTDASARGMHAARSISEVVCRDMKSTPTGVVINRHRGEDELIAKMAQDSGLKIVGRVPEDPALAKHDALGRPLTGLPEESPSVAAVREILRRVGLG